MLSYGVPAHMQVSVHRMEKLKIMLRLIARPRGASLPQCKEGPAVTRSADLARANGRLHRRVLSPFRLAFYVAPELSFFSACKFRLRSSRARRYALMENSSNNEWHTTDMRRPFREGGTQRAFLQSLFLFSA